MKEGNRKVDLFLHESGVWEGLFTNFVNREETVIQKGKIRVKVTVNKDGIITHENAIFDKEGNPGPYTGTAKMKVEGNRLINLLEMAEDPISGTKIENHNFTGFILDNHIHVLETYDDVFPDGKTDHRRNTVHYYFVSEKEMYMLADVYVNDKLLVFANTVLKKID